MCRAANSPLYSRPRSLDLSRDTRQQPIGVDTRHRGALTREQPSLDGSGH
jgi:hypothetical protein